MIRRPPRSPLTDTLFPYTTLFRSNEDLLLYVNVSKGYKAGSIPTLAGAIYDAYLPVTQESLLDFEGGFKIQLMDRKLSINGAAFYYDYKDKQLRAKFVDPIFGALDKLVNVRSEERRVGKECVSRCRSRWWRYH